MSCESDIDAIRSTLSMIQGAIGNEDFDAVKRNERALGDHLKSLKKCTRDLKRRIGLTYGQAQELSIRERAGRGEI